MTLDLALLWAGVIGFAVMLYVLLDGFDLGIGILFPFVKKREHKDVMMNSIAPVWDGNETWLVLGGAGLFAAFPKAYSMILPALYLPLMLFLLGLILRGVAFEFRFKAKKYQSLWNISFSGGAILATFMQGIVLGAFIDGFPYVDGKYIGKSFNWLTPFSAFCGIGLMAGYALLGATYLIIKTEGSLQEWCRKAALKLMFAVLLFIGAVSLWTPLAHPAIAERWFSWPNILYLAPVPVHTALLALTLFIALRKRWEYLPFIASVGLFLLSYTGLAISLWPYIVPRVLTIWQAAAPPESQLFLLTGVLLLIPVVLAYTVHSYWVFRGKTDAEDHHH